MYMTRLSTGGNVGFERFKSKEQIIAELKEQVKYLENERAQKIVKWINTDTENMMLKKTLSDAQKEIAALRKKASSSDTVSLKEKIKELEEERDHFRLLYERAEWELNHSKSSDMSFDIFKNCNSLENLSKRKKALLSIFHPDSECGDNEITRMILEQYNKRKANYQ